MANKKENSGGKKFQNRQPGEKRIRSSKTGPEKKNIGNKFKSKTGDSAPRGFNAERNEQRGYNKTSRNKGFSDDTRPKGKFGQDRREKREDFKSRDQKTGEFVKRGSYTDKPSFGPGRNKKQEFSNGTKPKGKFGQDRREKREDFKSRDQKTGEFAKRRTYTDKPSFGPGRNKSQRFSDDIRPKKRFGEGVEKRGEGFEKREEGSKFKGPKRSNAKFGGHQEKGSFAPKSRGGRTDNKRTFGPKREFEKREAGPKSFDGRSRSNNFKGRGKTHERAGKDLEKGKMLMEEEVRLNRYIANSGLGSRREADVMIEQGLVIVNGKPVTELGTKVKPGDEVKVDGRRITPEKFIYILLNKPKGYITTTDDPEGRKTVMELIDLPGKERIYPVGRLDRNTTGVLLLTNDGDLAQKLMHPGFEIKKIYKARLDKKPGRDHMLAWVDGVELEDGFMSFEQVGFVDPEDDTVLGLEVHSGRNRIVRRMFEHFGYEVEALDRVMLGDFDHLKLGRGKWRFLNEKEIHYVERLKRMKGKKKQDFKK